MVLDHLHRNALDRTTPDLVQLHNMYRALPESAMDAMIAIEQQGGPSLDDALEILR